MYGFIVITVAVVYTCVLHDKFMNNVNKLNLVIIEIGLPLLIVTWFLHNYDVKCVTKKKNLSLFTHWLATIWKWTPRHCQLCAVWCWHYHPVQSIVSCWCISIWMSTGNIAKWCSLSLCVKVNKCSTLFIILFFDRVSY